jgi:hypothetical protein
MDIRFKRVGPNAMRGRGIGTARGRATIMRGMCFISLFFSSTHQLLTPTYSKWYELFLFKAADYAYTFLSARRGRGGMTPQVSRGIRR